MSTDKTTPTYVTASITYKNQSSAEYKNVFEFKCDDNWFIIKYHELEAERQLRVLFLNRSEILEIEIF